MQTRLISRVGTRVRLRKEWGGCPRPEHEWSTEHEAWTRFDVLGEAELPDDTDPRYAEATHCSQCGEEAPEDANRFALSGPLYDTPSGLAEPGSVYYVRHDPEDWCWFGWENCDGWHLVAVLPTGHHWHVSQRASNCTRPDDNTHRCWVVEEPPPNVTVGKNGDTCAAGAGSIAAGSYHGFLRGGVFTNA